jgi:hypothetical protein
MLGVAGTLSRRRSHRASGSWSGVGAASFPSSCTPCVRKGRSPRVLSHRAMEPQPLLLPPLVLAQRVGQRRLCWPRALHSRPPCRSSPFCSSQLPPPAGSGRPGPQRAHPAAPQALVAEMLQGGRLGEDDWEAADWKRAVVPSDSRVAFVIAAP